MSLSGQADLPKEAAEAVRLGKLLYRSEMASWHGSDIFMERFAQFRDRSGGYVSYPAGKSTTCTFFSKDADARVFCRIVFDSTFNVPAATVDTANHIADPIEVELLSMRAAAIKAINGDDLFEQYKDMRFNLIPLIDGGKRMVYVLSGPQNSGVVVLGNDYLITMNDEFKVRSKERLHKNILTFESHEDMDSVTTTMHSHLPETGDFITATDICTLMLYAPYEKWPQHIVISNKQVSIWNCITNELVTMDRKAWDRIAKDQEERH